MCPHDETFNSPVIPLACQTNFGGEILDLIDAVEGDRDCLDESPLFSKSVHLFLRASLRERPELFCRFVQAVQM